MPRDQKTDNHLWELAQRSAAAAGLIPRTSWHDASTGTITGLFARTGSKRIRGKVVIRGGMLITAEGEMRALLHP